VQPVVAVKKTGMIMKKKSLVICTRNSARSRMILRSVSRAVRSFAGTIAR
jgi:hypothetical protein